MQATKIEAILPPPPPCVLIYTFTRPISFPFCTLDPHIDEWSRLAHQTSPVLMKSWPLNKLLSNSKNKPPIVIDYQARLGYFSFQSASLGATVYALEKSLPLFQLMKISLQLNNNQKNHFNISIIHQHQKYHRTCTDLMNTSETTQIIDILRINAINLYQNCFIKLKNGHIKYIFLDFTPSDLDEPIKFLKKLSKTFNIFEDEHANEGAIEEKFFASLIKGIGNTTRTLFLAHNMMMR
jgi:hypothetical protein